jgi:hypothetical protein
MFSQKGLVSHDSSTNAVSMHPLISLLQRSAKFYNRLRSPSPKEVELAFTKIVSALNKTPMRKRFWMCGGILLGYAREGRLLSHDTDIDFHYWVEDEEILLDVLKNLCQHEFSYVGEMIDNNNRCTQHVIRYGKVKIDFFVAWRVDGKVQWTCYTTPHWNRPSRQYLNEIPDLQTAEVEFYGLPVSKPIDHETYLQAIYGNWMEPMVDYTYYVDSCSIIACEPWRQKK